jgi:hypothetical protein
MTALSATALLGLALAETTVEATRAK